MSRKKKVGIFLIIVVIVGLFSLYKYLNFTYDTYANSTLNLGEKSSVSAELGNLIGGSKWKEPIYKVGDLEKYYKEAHSINPQVAGWIFIEGTNINYPILHGEEDSYYLKHNWKGESYWNGSIFLDHANSGFNDVSLINGHNMLNGIMFSQLLNFENKDFFSGNHDIYIYEGDENKTVVYKAVGALYCEPNIDLTLGNMNTSVIKEEFDSLMSKSFYGQKTYNGGTVLLLNTCLSNGTGKHLLVIAESENKELKA